MVPVTVTFKTPAEITGSAPPQALINALRDEFVRRLSLGSDGIVYFAHSEGNWKRKIDVSTSSTPAYETSFIRKATATEVATMNNFNSLTAAFMESDYLQYGV